MERQGEGNRKPIETDEIRIVVIIETFHSQGVWVFGAHASRVIENGAWWQQIVNALGGDSESVENRRCTYLGFYLFK